MQAPGKFSITPVTAAVTAALYPGYAAIAQEQPSSQEFLDEIIVTSRKRTESVQDIPATIQAITQESLAAMGAKTMEDYARFVPSVNVVQYGGAASEVVFRGASTGPGYIGQATSSVYLDEISITQTGSQPTIRAVDIARIEALSGPQGTLYGSDAQAGTMRIITNQPVMNTFEAIFDGEARGGGDSDASYRGSLVFNIPLVEDKLALRVAGYSDHDGGYIDNVFGRTPDWYGLEDRSDPANNKAPAQWGTLDNSAVVENNWNDVDVYGGRVHLRWEINDEWALTASGHYQKTDMGADSYFDPFVGDLKVIRFHDEWREEEFNMGSLKLEADLGFAELVAAVSYYERKQSILYDITTYAHYWAAQYCHDSNYTPAYIDANPQYFPYYTSANVWANPDTGYVVWWPVYCQGPTIDSDFFSSYETDKWVEDDKLSTEIRLQGQGDTLDWILGFYIEDSKDSWVAPFAEPTAGGNGQTNLYQSSMSLNFWEFYFSNYYGTPVTYPDAEMHWWSQSQTDWEQTAVFGEVNWHITDQLELTLGGRYFDRSNTQYYLVNHPGGHNPSGSGLPVGEPDVLAGEDRQDRLANGGKPSGRKGTETQFVPKVSLSYRLGDDKMVYGLYTEGVRQGGVNRSRGQPFFPNIYDSDLMKNYELGYKSYFAGGKGRFNVTAYYMQWEDYQLQIVDPSSQVCIDPDTGLEDDGLAVAGLCGQPWQAVVANLGEAHIQGINVEVDYAPNDNWMFGLNFEEIEGETDTAHDLDADTIIDPDAGDLQKGLTLPLVPDYKASAWIEYRQPTTWLGGQELFVRTQWSHSGESLNRLEPFTTDWPNPQLKNPGYTIGDVRAGIVGEDWQFDVFVNNVTDERAWYTIQNGLYEWGAAQLAEGRPHHQSVFVNRPLEFGIRFMKRWSN